MTEPKSEDMTNGEIALDLDEIHRVVSQDWELKEAPSIAEAARRFRAFDDLSHCPVCQWPLPDHGHDPEEVSETVYFAGHEEQP